MTFLFPGGDTLKQEANDEGGGDIAFPGRVLDGNRPRRGTATWSSSQGRAGLGDRCFPRLTGDRTLLLDSDHPAGAQTRACAHTRHRQRTYRARRAEERSAAASGAAPPAPADHGAVPPSEKG